MRVRFSKLVREDMRERHTCFMCLRDGTLREGAWCVNPELDDDEQEQAYVHHKCAEGFNAAYRMVEEAYSGP